VLFVLVFGFGYWLIHLLLATTQLPDMVQKMRRERAQNNARKRLDITIKTYLEGRYAEAEKAASRAIKHGESSVIYPLIAARSADELGMIARRDSYLSQGQSYQQVEARMLDAVKLKFLQNEVGHQ